MTRIMLSLALLLVGFEINIRAEGHLSEVNRHGEEELWNSEFDDCCGHQTILKVLKLCAEKIRTKCLRAEEIKVHELCAKEGTFDTVCSHESQAEVVYTNSVFTGDLCAQNAYISNLCTDTLSAPNICFQEVCNRFRAYAGFAADTSYTLGTDINYDTISEDPNGNILVGPTRYIAPKTGWYLTAVGLDMENIITTAPVLGTPVASADVFVNGVLRHRALMPFLAFSNQEDGVHTNVVRLNAGDEVTVIYNVLIQDPVLGQIDLAGSVTLLGDSANLALNFFSIIYLTSTCDSCAPCNVTCTPFTPVTCNPGCTCDCD